MIFAAGYGRIRSRAKGERQWSRTGQGGAGRLIVLGTSGVNGELGDGGQAHVLQGKNSRMPPSSSRRNHKKMNIGQSILLPFHMQEDGYSFFEVINNGTDFFFFGFDGIVRCRGCKDAPAGQGSMRCFFYFRWAC